MDECVANDAEFGGKLDECVANDAEISANPVICIAGPTASGKSDLAVRLAVELGRAKCEIVSADSIQIYKGMDIGTGKISAEEMQGVVHHGIDICTPGDQFSVANYQKFARNTIDSIRGAGKTAILCGGTGLYINATIDEYDFKAGNQVDNPVRDRYNALLEQIGNEALWEMLRKQDPKSAALIHPNNARRVVRAFELLHTGTPYYIQYENAEGRQSHYPVLYLCMNVDAEILASRISDRVDAMFDAGLVAEVESLLNDGFRDAICAPQAIGYKEVVAALDGETTLEFAREKIKTNSRRYAKRQRTWFRADDRIIWIDANSGNVEESLAQVLGYVSKENQV